MDIGGATIFTSANEFMFLQAFVSQSVCQSCLFLYEITRKILHIFGFTAFTAYCLCGGLWFPIAFLVLLSA